MKKISHISGVIAGFIVLCLFNHIDIAAQSSIYKLTWFDNEITESYRIVNDQQYRYLKFDNAYFTDGEYFPRYLKSIKLNESNPQIIYYLSDLTYSEIPDSILNLVKLPDILPESVPKVYSYLGKGEKYLEIDIFPIRKNNGSGKYERLVSYSINDSVDSEIFVAPEVFKKQKAAINSVLAEGNWYKVRVTESGIYKLTYSDLVGMNISEPANIRVYGNGGKQLSYSNADTRPVDLNECPIYMNKGEDGVFNNDDYILFYAEGPVTWKKLAYKSNDYIFKQYLHEYSNGSFYFLTSDKGPSSLIQTIDNNNLVHNVDVSSFTDYGYYEKNLINLIQSGRGWFSERIDNSQFDTLFIFPDIITQQPVKIQAKLVGRAESARKVELLADNSSSSSILIPGVDVSSNQANYAAEAILELNHNPAGNNINVNINYNKYSESEEAYLDYVTINVRRNLKISGNSLFFRDEKSANPGNISKYIIQGADSKTIVWDITDINSTFQIKGNLNGTTLEFKANSSELREYVAFNPTANYPKPAIVANENKGKIANQNLHGLQTVNYVIVTAKVFKEQAERLAAFHREKSGLTVLVVTPEEIYNEFSSGALDVSAIRDFLKYQYENGNGENSLRYVLLFGDGSYNNHMDIENNTNYIPTYQSDKYLNPVSSNVIDDFFGLLDKSDNGVTCFGKLEIGVGRFPANLVKGKTTEAEILVDKVINYYNSEKTDWRSSLCFMGDDKSDEGKDDNMNHMVYADSLANMVEKLKPGMDLKKIHLDAYQQMTSASGPSYPEAQRELFKTLNKGVLIWNYIGHSGPGGITAEKVFQSADIGKLKNKKKLFLFITGSCSLSKFDDGTMVNNTFTAKNSCGELILLHPDGGAVALYSTTRAVFPDANFKLNQYVYNSMFIPDSTGYKKRLGDILREAKNGLPNQDNKLKFALLGDPALMLQIPEYKVVTDSVNHMPVEYGADTLRAYETVTVSGHLEFDNNTIINDFNGFVYPRIYDKPVTVTTLGNDGASPFVYIDQRNIIYKGKATVEEGKFTFSFIVPIDISYNKGKGKICYYAENGSYDAQGRFDNIYIGGTGSEPIIDNEGPVIKLFLNNESFEDGGMTNTNPQLLAQLSDENGINTTGIGIGHDIVGVLDDDFQNIFILNDFYQAHENNYRSGIVTYPFEKIEQGEHKLYFKAWDIFNNSSEEYINFYVTDAEGIVLEKVISYPNPVTEKVYFQYTHNAPDQLHTVELEVFDLAGRTIIRRESSAFESGFVSTPIEWDLCNSGGNHLQTGVYPYRLKVVTTLGTSYINQKLIIIK